MRKIAAFVAAISLLGVAIVFGAGNGVCMHISVPLSIVHTLRELRECTILLAIVIVILFVEMWCEYIRACLHWAHIYCIIVCSRAPFLSLSLFRFIPSVQSPRTHRDSESVLVFAIFLANARVNTHIGCMHTLCCWSVQTPSQLTFNSGNERTRIPFV